VNNGSVFCVCLLGSFVESLAAFIEQIQTDELIMEASGMSDPLSIGQILQSPKLKKKVYLDRVWCFVDAINFRKISGLQTRVNHQVRIADTIIINKVDLADPKDDSLEQLIRKLNPFAGVHLTSFACVEFDWEKSGMKFLPVHEKAEYGRPELESQVIKSTRTISSEKLNEFLLDLKQGCIRCKGYINLKANRKVFLQGSFDQLTLTEIDFFAAPTEFVAIGNFTEKQSFQKLYDSFCMP
jgi:G3E family GTPase